jgi:hypothetical protein
MLATKHDNATKRTITGETKMRDIGDENTRATTGNTTARKATAKADLALMSDCMSWRSLYIAVG